MGPHYVAQEQDPDRALLGEHLEVDGVRDRAGPISLEVLRLVEIRWLILPDQKLEISSADSKNRVGPPHVPCGAPEELPAFGCSLVRLEHRHQPLDVGLTCPALFGSGYHQQRASESHHN